MLILKEENLLAEGAIQKCYFHPNDERLCIKIDKNLGDIRLVHEINYSKKISKKNFNTFDYPFFAKHHKEIETNLGNGHVYDLVRDETTGNVSKTMSHYLLNKEENITDESLKNAFDRLIKMMIKHKVIANDLQSHNICCKILKNNTIEMVLIDGLGHRDFLPLVDWFSYFAQKKIERRLVKHHFTNFENQRNYLKEFYGLNK